MEECYQVVNNYLDKVVLFTVFIIVLLDIHFTLVVYTHWKNHGNR